ncbi:MAG: SpoIIE family protein phosphatase [Lachnospiraceae bacterium]|nr:SpoIIE family protein phosphatase [Lachnospiraceae bacterium]
MPDVCGIRLYGYAESFRELAKSFEKKEPSKTLDRRSYFEEERLRENCGVIAGHLTEVAQIMEQAAGEVIKRKPLEEKAWSQLVLSLGRRDLILNGACLFGERGDQISLSLRTNREEGIRATAAQDALEEALGKRFCLSMKSGEWVGRDLGTFLYVEEPGYLAFTGFARVIKSRERISGDNYSILQLERGILTLLLSDGTGSGEKASLGSGFVLDLTEKLLEAGYHPETAVKMVNATAVTKGEEMGHPTLDACSLDLRRGDCLFCKAGGAVSFRKRGSEVEEIAPGQLPLGIFSDLEPQKQYMHLEEGDSVILMTDGVLEAFRERGYEEAAKNCLAGMEDLNPREIAEKLMQFAIFASEGNVRDDMTILVATLWKNP